MTEKTKKKPLHKTHENYYKCHPGCSVLLWMYLGILLVKLQNGLQCKHDIAGKYFDLQCEECFVDLMEDLKIHQANFILLVENQYTLVSYLSAEYPRRNGGVDEG